MSRLRRRLRKRTCKTARRVLWRGEAGKSARRLLEDVGEAASDLPVIDARSYASLFRGFADEKAVRPAYGRHPRLAILGPLEARLQRFDLVVLGGLNEGEWPAQAPVDPWLSRPMRRILGLEQPERAISLAAHDFATLAAAPRVILTRSRKSRKARPRLPSRWLQRLMQLTRGLELEEKLRTSRDCPIAILHRRCTNHLSRRASGDLRRSRRSRLDRADFR